MLITQGPKFVEAVKNPQALKNPQAAKNPPPQKFDQEGNLVDSLCASVFSCYNVVHRVCSSVGRVPGVNALEVEGSSPSIPIK